ncbi:MAG: hypothetical protein IIB75_02170 [Proteobacteria bacterium]|nr:hypothetical protein [Pseudomonadota bacterium]
MAALAAIILFAGSASVHAEAGAGKFSKAGYLCFPAGPSNFTHCLLERHFGNPVIPVKGFSPDGNKLLGTEQLLREDIYAGHH